MTDTAAGARRAPAWLVVGPPVATLVVVLVALGVASDGFTAGGFDGWTVAFLAWDLSPSLTGTALAARAARTRRGVRAVAVGGVVLLLVTLGLLVSIALDDSSTAALGYLVVPLAGWAVVAVTWAVAMGTRGRSTSR